MNIDIKELANQAFTRIKPRTQPRTNREQEPKTCVHGGVKKDAVLFTPNSTTKKHREKIGFLTREHQDEHLHDHTLECFDKSKMAVWNCEDKALIDWFLSATDIPTDPFQLKLAVKVEDTQKYYACLRSDIAHGPKGPRARYGALQGELRLLKEMVESQGMKNDIAA